MSKSKSITSFSEIRLRISGFSSLQRIFEIESGDQKAKVSECHFVAGTKEPIRSCTASNRKILRILNCCNVLEWDGFVGNNPPGVFDGTQFDFSAVLNGGRTIYASGSNNFPKHFSEFSDAISRILNKA